VEKHRIDPAQVKTLRIGLSQPVFDLHGIFARYKAKFEALLSAHYVAAAILHDREMTVAQFEPARYDDPTLRRFAEQVEVKADPALSGVQSTVEIETADGKTVSARCDHPRGSPENRLSRPQIEQKFRTYAKGRLSDVQVDGGSARSLEQLGRCALMDMLRETAGERAPIAGSRADRTSNVHGLSSCPREASQEHGQHLRRSGAHSVEMHSMDGFAPRSVPSSSARRRPGPVALDVPTEYGGQGLSLLGLAVV
jgi:hypothetical protein